VRAESFAAVHWNDLLFDHLALGEADHQVTAEGSQRNVESRVAVGVYVHDRSLGLVVPGQVVLMIDRHRCPVGADLPDAVGGLLTPVDAVLDRARSGTAHRSHAQKEPGSQPPPHCAGL